MTVYRNPERFDLQILVNHFAPPAPLKVLEIGCGKGVNAKFFAKRGDRYTGIDAEDRVQPAYRRFGEFLVGDFCEAIPRGFDLIVDRGGVTMNADDAVRRAVALAFEALNGGGLFISADLFAEGNKKLALPRSRAFTRDQLQRLFAPFQQLHLEMRVGAPTFDYVGRKP